MNMNNHLTQSTAAENLVGFSTAQPSLFKRNTLEPIADLKLLIKDYTAIAKNALTMLINLTDDEEIIKTCVDDEVFLENLLKRVTVRTPSYDESAYQKCLCHTATDKKFRTLRMPTATSTACFWPIWQSLTLSPNS